MQLIDLHPEPADIHQLVLEGMARQPRQLPAWLLYDAEGSRLFDLICQQPEYTLTATETALLEREAPAIAAALGPGTLVEFGAGSARKVAPLLQALAQPAYVALDISAEHLEAACTRLQGQFPAVPILGVCCDYSQLQALPEHPLLSGSTHLGFFPGSSLGNFEPEAACALLRQFRRLLGPGGTLLIGSLRMVGVVIAFQLAFPSLNLGNVTEGILNFGRLRPLHTSAVIFAFGGNALIMTAFYVVQRTSAARLWGGNLGWFVFWGWQLMIVLAASSYILGGTQGKEYAETVWYIDLWITVVWVAFLAVFVGT